MASKNSNAAKDRARLQNYQAKQNLQSSKAARRAKDNRRAIIAGVVAVGIALGGQLTYFGFGPGTPTPTPTSLIPSTSVAENRIWNGSMEINGKTVEIQLDGTKAPQAVANFVTLAKNGFYEGNSCHRLVTAGIYVLQCGDPKGDGTGGPGYSWGPIENAPVDNKYITGALAMARQGGNGSSMGSQFFIVTKDSVIPADAAGGYTVFGYVTSGGAEALTPTLQGGVVGGGTDGKPAVTTILSNIKLN